MNKKQILYAPIKNTKWLLILSFFFLSFTQNNLWSQCEDQEFVVMVVENTMTGLDICEKQFDVLLITNGHPSLNAVVAFNIVVNVNGGGDIVSPLCNPLLDCTVTNTTASFSFFNDRETINMNAINNLGSFVVKGEPGECFSFSEGVMAFVLPPFVFCSDNGQLDAPGTVCFPEADLFCGTIEHIDDCANTLNNKIQGATVTATPNGECGTPSTTVTGPSGTYCIETFPGQCVDITVTADGCDCGESINEQDMYMMIQFLLSTATPSSADLWIADINGSGTITTLDLIALQKHILGLQTLPGIGDCQFTRVSSLFGGLNNFSNTTNTCADLFQADFVMSVLGDVNRSCNDCIVRRPLNVVEEDITFVKQEEKTNISLVENSEMNFLSIALNAEEELNLEDIQVNLPTEDYTVNLTKYKENIYIIIIANTIDKAPITEPIISVHSSANVSLKNGMDHTLMDISEELKILKPKKSKVIGTIGKVKAKINSASFGVYPNPASDLIHIQNTNKVEVTVEFFSVEGKLVKQVNVNEMSQELLNVGDLPRGIYFLSIYDKASKQILKSEKIILTNK